MKRYRIADDMKNIIRQVHSLYGMDWDSKGHTGAIMSMGRDAIVNVSRKHKLNTGSSTESGMVSIANGLGIIMWCKYFMKDHGYTIDNNLMY